MEKKYKLLSAGNYNVSLGSVKLYKDSLSNLISMQSDNRIIKFKDEIYLMFNEAESNYLSEKINRIISKGYKNRVIMVFEDDPSYKLGKRFFISYYYTIHNDDLFLLHKSNNNDLFNFCKFMVDINTDEMFTIYENIIYEDTLENKIKAEKIIEIYNDYKTIKDKLNGLLVFKNVKNHLKDYEREEYIGDDIICLNDMVIEV